MVELAWPLKGRTAHVWVCVKATGGLLLASFKPSPQRGTLNRTAQFPGWLPFWNFPHDLFESTIKPNKKTAPFFSASGGGGGVNFISDRWTTSRRKASPWTRWRWEAWRLDHTLTASLGVAARYLGSILWKSTWVRLFWGAPPPNDDCPVE